MDFESSTRIIAATKEAHSDRDVVMRLPHFFKIISYLLISFTISSCGGSGGGGVTDDPSVIGDGQPEILEGDSGTSQVTLPFVAQISGLIKYNTFDLGAVEESDFVPLVGEYTVEEGTEYAIIVEVLGDERIEGDEDFGVLITDENGQELTRLYGKIVNDDFPSYTVTATDVTEVDNGTSNLVYTITLSESTIDDFVLNAATVSQTGNGIATADEDYRPVNEEVVFTRGELTKTVAVTVFGDTDVEPDEAVTLSVTHASGMEQSATAYIRTDDVPGSGNIPTFEINGGRPIAVSENFSARDSEGYNQFDVTFTLHPDFAGSVTEAFDLTYQLIALDSYEYPDEAALADEDDFDPTPGVITILPETGGSSSPREYTATVRILDDSELEGTEVLGFLLSNGEGAQFGFTYVLIRDNESPDFDVTVTGGVNDSLAIVEGDTNNPQTITVTYPEGQSGNAQDFRYSLFVEGSGNNKAALDDFISPAGGSVITSGTIRVGDGISSGENQISFTLNGDDVTEGNEEFYLQIFDESGNELQRQNGELIIYTFTIIDDDLPSVRWARVNDDGDESASDPLADVSGNINICEDGSFAGTDHCLATVISDVPSANGADVTESEPYHLYLVLGDSGASAALQNYAINITAVSTAASCNWTANGVLLEEDEYELQHSGTFAEGASRYRVRFTPENDDLVECDETVTLQATLSSADFSAVAGTEQSNDLDLTVKNNDISYVDIIGFSAYEELADAGSQAAQSGSTDTNAATVYRIRQTLAANTAVEYARIFGATDASDYAPVEDQLFASLAAAVGASGLTELALSDTTEHLIGSLIVDDSVVEQNETAQLAVRFKASVYSSTPGDYPMALRVCASGNATSCSPATSIGSYSANAEASGTILNDELVKVNLSSGPAVVNGEIYAEESAGVFSVYTISLTTVDSAGNNLHSGADFSGFSVTLAATLSSCADTDITSACATSGTDYSITAGDLINLSTLGNGNEVIELSFTDDSIVEPDETGTLTLALSAGSEHFIFNHSEVDGKSLNITIENDDVINPNITAASEEGNEGNSGDSHVNFTISLGAQVASNVSDLSLAITDSCQVDASTGCGNDTDYTVSPTTLNLTGSDGSETVVLTIEGDTTIEPDEIVTLTIGLANGSNAGYLSDEFESSAAKSDSYKIVNDDFLQITVPSNVTLNESHEDKSFSVTVSGSVAENVGKVSITLQLDATCSGNICADSDDVNALSETVLHNAGNATVFNSDTYTLVTVVDDNLVEPTERFDGLMTISGGEYTNLSSPASFSFNIVSDDKITMNSPSVTGSPVAEGSGDQVSISISWSGTIADNTPLITVIPAEQTCDTYPRVKPGDEINIPAAKAISNSSSSPLTFQFSAVDDDVVELNEQACVTFTTSIASGALGVISDYVTFADPDASFTVTNDDYFSVSLLEGENIGQKEGAASYRVNVSADEYQFSGTEEDIVTISFFPKVITQYSLDGPSLSDGCLYDEDNNGYCPEDGSMIYLEQNEVASETDFSAGGSGHVGQFTFDASDSTQPNYSEDQLLTLQFTDDVEREFNEWLLLVAEAQSSNGTVCASGSACLVQPIIIANDEVQSVVGTGTSNCIVYDSVADQYSVSTDEAVCTDNPDYPETNFNYVAESGEPLAREEDSTVSGELTAPDEYLCVQDNLTGYMWMTYEQGETSLPVVSDPGASLSFGTVCGVSGWQIPTLPEMLSLIEYGNLSIPEDILRTVDTQFWTSSVCDQLYNDSLELIDKMLVLDITTGLTSCIEASSATYKIFPVYKYSE